MISTKGRYALRMLADLAAQGAGACVPLRGMAQRQGISDKYLQHVAKLLVEKHLLVGVSGKGGGYQLARPAACITALEVLEAAEGTVAPVACLAPGASACSRAAQCTTLPLWKRYSTMTRDFFGGVTIADLVDGGAGDLLEATGE